MISINADEYYRLNEENAGFCPYCGIIDAGGFEPDALGYECPDCGEMSAVGLEEALMAGHLEVME